ncbi:ceramide synthase 2-like [Paramormyrops kingsleyae]|uniref:Ceramide synthase 2-like n=1 Tax=Paramormyrops kingsleyae TaxID=1676925 RepID=A0A3B3R6S9_9TELE|nr:ceramide synthase 2-like [Paramormyrops kingsleyae]XP_023674699.1 ceramide synthase 2-like [Paramormyrops kingsleyae]
MEFLNQWLWRHEYWLPPGVTWKDMEDLESYPLPQDLLPTLGLALAFIALRHVFERLVALPLSSWLGVRDRVRIPAAPVPALEDFYGSRGNQPSQREVLGLAKQCDLTRRQVEVWFRCRRNQDRPTNTKKFCEACWRFAFYLTAFSAGLASLLHSPWFWDRTTCWKAYPRQPVQTAHYWYYLLELGFYWSLLFCVSVDIKRKDFKEQIIHHVAAIVLLGFSYCSNYVRIGTLVMLVHDSSDFLLESAKMFNYAGWRRTCDFLFVVFTVAFLVTRLVVFPSKIIHTTLVLSMEEFQPFFGYYFFNGLLLVLQGLHIFWAWLILRMVYKFLCHGKVEKDERSDEDSDPEEVGEEEEPQWERRKEALNCSLAVLANNCVLSNLTSQRGTASAQPSKTR